MKKIAITPWLYLVIGVGIGCGEKHTDTAQEKPVKDSVRVVVKPLVNTTPLVRFAGDSAQEAELQRTRALTDSLIKATALLHDATDAYMQRVSVSTELQKESNDEIERSISESVTNLRGTMNGSTAQRSSKLKKQRWKKPSHKNSWRDCRCPQETKKVKI